ncbi:MAG TPA: bifunctional phosphoribosylaminoimidazolecarboxamide formyltransferase/IMP cyclohydrolase, partial [Planctomycetota bacterium]|nr:bifunctional phosphoribosylaminoimidazolecarboxamide formyltransferase/IMP cyclohydrolase [Planctomycetota bacterium]
MIKIKTAVVSVSDKANIVEFARHLKKYKVEIISTGGTAKSLQENRIGVTPISKITGNSKDEYFDGRMKTISFNYESALLYKRNNAQHAKQARELKIPQIDMVVCNLYPFEKVVAKEDITNEEAIENIDIGGPCMVRAAAKNYEWVVVVTDPAQYKEIMAEMDKYNGSISLEMRKKLMIEAFNKTADYDSAIHTYFSSHLGEDNTKRIKYQSGKQLGRYAENWHQKGWIYKSSTKICSIPWAHKIYGGELGYNNYLDAEGALQSVMEIKDYIAVSIIKHANPCGYATGKTMEEAFEKAWAGDPVSAFGSVIALSRPLDISIAQILGERFVEVVVAPSVSKEALSYIRSLGKKKENLRLLEVGPLSKVNSNIFRFVTGGVLEQEQDNKFYLTKTIEELFKRASNIKCENSGKDLTVGIVTKVKPPAKRAKLYEFGLRYIKHLKSNAIGIIREYEDGLFQVIGMGCGQPNRKDSVTLAAQKAYDHLKAEYEKN